MNKQIRAQLKTLYSHNQWINTVVECLDNILSSANSTSMLEITCKTILLEGFYRSLPNDTALKQAIRQARSKRWHNHYGVPTLSFLLTHHLPIEDTKLLFSVLNANNFYSNPWEINNQTTFVADVQNHVLVDKEPYHSVRAPTQDERIDHFLKTHNLSGGFVTAPNDPVSQQFIAHSVGKESVLEIGAGFGDASQQVLRKSTTLFCNDIEPKNLAVFLKRELFKSQNIQPSVTGDCNQLVMIPGAFPDELVSLPKNYFDAILICRVLHFLSGDKIDQSLKQLFTYLKPGGKLFIVCETPFLKNWQRFIPEFERRRSAGVKWPGEIYNPQDFENSGRAASLPTFVHWITKDVLERSLREAKFHIDELFYISRHGQFPDDLLLDGRESVGAIVSKSIE